MLNLTGRRSSYDTRSEKKELFCWINGTWFSPVFALSAPIYHPLKKSKEASKTLHEDREKLKHEEGQLHCNFSPLQGCKND